MVRDLRVIYTIWLRELKAFLRDGRMIGTIGQPLLYLLILGQGIASGLTINRAPGVGYLQFMFPGILGMSVLFTSMFSAISIIWDREFGFLKEVLVAPVPRLGGGPGQGPGRGDHRRVPVDDPGGGGAVRRNLPVAADGRETACCSAS